MDIDGAALQAILASLKEQAVRVQAPMQEHADLGSAMLQLVEFEYVNGMEWGFHDKELRKDIAYSVSHSPLPPRPALCKPLHPLLNGMYTFRNLSYHHLLKGPPSQLLGRIGSRTQFTS